MRCSAALCILSVVAGSYGWTWEPKWSTDAEKEAPTQACRSIYSAELGREVAAFQTGCLQEGDRLTTFFNNNTFIPITTTSKASCAELCTLNKTWPTGTRVVRAVWDSERNQCTCIGAGKVVNPPALQNSTPKSCVLSLLELPLLCMWLHTSDCHNTPAPPEGCTSYKNCCISSQSTSQPDDYWPPPWWVWLSMGFMISLCLCGVFLGIFIRCFHLPIRRGTIAPATSPEMSLERDTPSRREYHKEDFETFLEKCKASEVPSDTEECCCICLEVLAGAHISLLGCKHRIHQACIQEYIIHVVSRAKYPRCPICRTRIMYETDTSLLSSVTSFNDHSEEDTGQSQGWNNEGDLVVEEFDFESASARSSDFTFMPELPPAGLPSSRLSS